VIQLRWYWTNGQLDVPTSSCQTSVMIEAVPRIAVVDDDPSVLKALKRLLHTRSFCVQTFESAQRFLAALPDSLPDCLIVDLQMPEMDGIELLQRLAGMGVPMIVITAHSEVGVRERCESAGAVAFLLKPLQDTSLFAAIDASIGVAGSPRAPDGCNH
jgi:FixJ family two-component response regulator